MKIHTVIRKGSEHRVFCEDYLWTLESERFIGAAILDGCSTGTESHFASALFGKALKSQFNFFCDQSLSGSAENTMKHILHLAISNVNIVRAQLQLGIGELLATVIFALYEKKTKRLHVIVIGDGVVVVNGEEHIIDQNNMPDYVSYHIERLVHKIEFEKWFEEFKNKFIFEDVNDFSICSDGILSFKTTKETTEEKVNPLEFLTKDSFLINNISMLARKCNILENKHGMVHQDDLSIIRIYSEPEKQKTLFSIMGDIILN